MLAQCEQRSVGKLVLLDRTDTNARTALLDVISAQ